jgi:hypothetical protein
VRSQHNPTGAPSAAASALIVCDLDWTAIRVHQSSGHGFKGGTSWVKHHLFKRVKYHLLNQGGANTARRG